MYSTYYSDGYVVPWYVCWLFVLKLFSYNFNLITRFLHSSWYRKFSLKNVLLKQITPKVVTSFQVAQSQSVTASHPQVVWEGWVDGFEGGRRILDRQRSNTLNIKACKNIENIKKSQNCTWDKQYSGQTVLLWSCKLYKKEHSLFTKRLIFSWWSLCNAYGNNRKNLIQMKNLEPQLVLWNS